MELTKYHPLVDCVPDGTEKIPLFYHTSEKEVSLRNEFYLYECVSGYYRLRTETTKNASKCIIHCPKCGAKLKAISPPAKNRLPLYTCLKCKKYK